MKTNTIISLLLIMTAMISGGCTGHLPEQGDISKTRIKLLDQDSSEVVFPANMYGKNYFVTFFFTHCPDICPMTTNNMQQIEKAMAVKDMKNFEFVAISFDPQRDRPSVLQQYADMHGIDLKKWHMLTGTPENVDSLRKLLNIVAVKGDTVLLDSGMPQYYFVHTDRITLVDANGKIRKRYKGSQISLEEIITDTKKL